MKLANRLYSRSLLLLLIALSTSAYGQYRVVGYYPMWERTTLAAAAVRYDILTCINHAFAWPNTDGSIASDDNVVDTAIINTTHRNGRKILLSFGGAGTTQTNNFAVVTSDSSLRKTFIANIVSRLAAYHYDGADLDWEGPSTVAQKNNEVAFVRDLRAAFHSADSTWLITMAIGASDWSGQWRDFTTLKTYVDWFNAMEYDFHGSWSAVAGHNAPLNIGTDPNTDNDSYSIVQSVQYLAGTRAIPKSQLVLGLPFYGKLFGTAALYTPYVGEQDLAYRDILTTLQSGNWTYIWDPGSNAPYYMSALPPKLITLDDSASIAVKCQYARTQGLSGVMIWEISQDVIGRNQPLLDVVGTQMTTTEVASGSRTLDVPSGFVLYDNYPNPFNPSTTISYFLPSAERVQLSVYDVLGREVRRLAEGYQTAGFHKYVFDGGELATGVYIYRISAEHFYAVKKMALVK
ncbi:MAG TPA: glycosyl hydrolase family 18 protein [Bacteroidota bacterium]|nr:glycosyl hydrolase family 18 protein [Bacteroidota bacterium]